MHLGRLVHKRCAGGGCNCSKLTNITINSFIDVDVRGSGIAAVNQEDKEEAMQRMRNSIVLIGWEGTDGLPTQ
jgi:N-acetylglucosamine-6-phosphate deacetylase